MTTLIEPQWDWMSMDSDTSAPATNCVSACCGLPVYTRYGMDGMAICTGCDSEGVECIAEPTEEHEREIGEFVERSVKAS